MSDRLRVAVCDDESRALAIVSSAVEGIFQDVGTEIIMEKFMDSAEFLERMNAVSFDLIFLDISMPKLDGIGVGKAIKAAGSNASIVFVSSRTDRMFDTFSVEPFGFVRKGHFMEDMNEVVTRFSRKRETQKNTDMVCFKDGHGVVSVDINHVKYIECVRNTQVLYFDNGQGQRKIYSRMEMLEEELRKYGFIRIHKGYLANCNYISCFEAKGLSLTTGDQIPIGRSYYQGAKAEFLEYISRSGASYIGKTTIPAQD